MTLHSYWRTLQAERREKQRRELAALRRLSVPPGAYGLRAGEEKVVTDSRGNRFVVVADASAVKHHRRR